VPDLRFFGRHETALRAHAHGRVLDLSSGRSRIDLEQLAATGERFDSVISIFALSVSHDPSRDARAIERLLADGGELLFLERTGAPGLEGRIERALGLGLHDISTILRDAGLSPRVCDRITVTAWFPPRRFVEGAALRTVAPALIEAS
jgi:SAM-dependent methyltransferase